MARIHLLTVYPESNPRPRGGYLSLLENAREDRVKAHQLVDDPAVADLILFVEVDVGTFCENVRQHPYVHRFGEKCFMFSTDFRVLAFLPGVYTGLEKNWYVPSRERAGFYPGCLINPLVKFEPDGERDLLYSFMGDIQTHAVRKVLARLNHSRGDFVDTSRESQAVMWTGSDDQREEFWGRYIGPAKRSKFILCPRGVSPSSIRMFETMCMGRVPVILSDAWVRPGGPEWGSFSIQVPERDAPSVIRIMEERESEALEMGLRARQEWEKYFSPDLLFHRAVELCLEIQKARRLPESLAWLSILPQFLRPRVFRELLRPLKNRLEQ
jgi:hypothetical protein